MNLLRRHFFIIAVICALSAPACSPPSENILGNVYALSFSPELSERHVVELIESAVSSIYVSLYGFENETISDALIDAHRRGVLLKMVTEYDSEHSEGWQEMIDHNIPVVLVNSNGIMHNKYFIVDMRYIVTGSTNLTEGMEVHYNNMILISSSSMAGDFKRDFDILFNGYASTRKDDGLLDIHGLTEWPEQKHLVGPYLMQVFFTPYRSSFPSYRYDAGGMDYTIYNYDDQESQVINYRHALNVIIPLIQNAGYQIYVMAFAFTDRVIAHELIQAYTQRGVNVRLYMDYNMYASQFNNFHRTYWALRDNLGPERARICRQGDGGLLHHKVMVIDNTLVLGSLNFSNNAVTTNDENFIIIENAGPLINEFKKEIEQVDRESHPIPY